MAKFLKTRWIITDLTPLASNKYFEMEKSTDFIHLVPRQTLLVRVFRLTIESNLN